MADLRIVGGPAQDLRTLRGAEPETFTCTSCERTGPWSLFYDPKRKVRSKRCKTCRHELRMERQRRTAARERRLLRKDLNPALLGQDPNYKYQRPANRDT